jgi:AraC-like DNA-binding protein
LAQHGSYRPAGFLPSRFKKSPHYPYFSLSYRSFTIFRMLFEFNVRSGMLLLFFLAGAVYAILLALRGRRLDSLSDKLLATFLLLCCLFIFPWMVGYAGWYDGSQGPYRNILFYTPFQHQLFFGPIIYFYVQSLLNLKFGWQRKDAWHFLPGCLYLLWNLVVFVTDRLVLKRYFLMDGFADPDFDTWYQMLGFIGMIFYGLLSIRYYYRYRRYTQQQLSFADSVGFLWVRNFLFAFTAYLVITAMQQLLGFLSELHIIRALDYGDSWWYYIVFSFIFYYIAISGYNNSTDTKVGFRFWQLMEANRPKELGFGGQQPGGVNTSLFETIEYEDVEADAPPTPAAEGDDGPAFLDAETLAQWKAKTEALLVSGGLYKNPELTLTILAKQLGTHTSFLSKVINNGFGMNFNDFVNGYRVQEVKKLLADAANAHVTIMGLAYEAGFNSKATFNRAFKKNTGQNPKDFLAELQRQGSNNG